MRETQFEYRGYAARVEIDEPSTESPSGIYLTTIVVQPVAGGEPITVCRRWQGIFLAEASALEAAMARARAYIDGVVARGQA